MVNELIFDKQELDEVNMSEQNEILYNPPQKIIDQLISLYNQGKSSLVLEKVESLTKKYPKSFVIWNILGVTSSVLGKKDIAVNSYKKCISANPNYPDAYSNMGLALHDQSKFDEAIEVYKKAISLNPNYVEAYSNMGVALNDQGKWRWFGTQFTIVSD